MVNWLIEVSLRNRFLVLGLSALLGVWGYWALLTTPIDAIPDLSDNQVIVFTEWTGRSPQEVEDQITYPLTVSLQGLPGVRVVRSSSAFGFSMINVIFADSVDLYFARSRVLERLNLLTKALPAGVVPTLGPDATGVGHVFWYTVEGEGDAPRDLRSLQDWFIRYQLNSVPGVAEVASIGGTVRQYQIDVDPTRLRAYKIPLSAVVDAVMRSNRNVGGNVVEASGSWSVVRGLGLIENVRDIEDIVVGAEGGVPIFIKQVAQVKVGDAFRAAALIKGTDEAVGGVVVARYGVSTVDVINRVKKKITALQAGLPAGVRIVSFLPVFALTGQEGKLFDPLAYTKTLSMIGATILSVTLVPVLCSLLIGGRVRGEEHNPVMRPLVWLYRPVLDFALRHRVATLAVAVLVVAGAAALVPRIGTEFMPPLNEGDLMFMPVTDPAIGLGQAIEITRKQNEAIQKFPEVASVVAKIARADTSTDPAPVNMTETVVSLKPEREWRPGMTREKLIGELDEATTLPGVSNIWTQPIINRINMLTTGIRSEVGVKVFGNDLNALQERARVIADVLRPIPGAADVYPEQVTGAPYLDIRVKREAAARYGITVGAVQDVIETAVGETNLTLTIEGRQRFPVRVRYAPEYRADPAALAGVLVTAPNGTQVPLGQVADIRSVSGPSMISSENGLLVVSVLLNVRGRDVGSFVQEARRAIAERVALPQGSYVEWSGQYENERRARERLQVVIPLVLIVIFVLLYLTYRSLLDAVQVLLAVPFGLAGGIYLLYALHYNFSVAVWVGFIALFGTAVQTAVVMVIYLEEAVAQKREDLGGRLTREALMEAVKEGALLRLRPKVMTVSTLVASLLPIMWSHSTGAEVMKPLATPVLGGMVSSLGLVLIVTPVIFYWLRERDLRRAEAEQRIDERSVREGPALESAD